MKQDTQSSVSTEWFSVFTQAPLESVMVFLSTANLALGFKEICLYPVFPGHFQLSSHRNSNFIWLPYDAKLNYVAIVTLITGVAKSVAVPAHLLFGVQVRWWGRSQKVACCT